MIDYEEELAAAACRAFRAAVTSCPDSVATMRKEGWTVERYKKEAIARYYQQFLATGDHNLLLMLGAVLDGRLDSDIESMLTDGDSDS